MYDIRIKILINAYIRSIDTVDDDHGE